MSKKTKKNKTEKEKQTKNKKEEVKSKKKKSKNTEKKLKTSKNKKKKKTSKKAKSSKKEQKESSKKPTSKIAAKTQNKDKSKLRKIDNMADLLEATDYDLQGLRSNQEIEGLITDITKKSVLIDVGAKTEGMVLDREFNLAQDYIETLKIGDTVTATVVQPENERGQVLLSLKEAANDFRWSRVEELLDTGEVVEVTGSEPNKGGIIVRFGNLRGFVPASQFGRQYLGKLKELVNKDISVKVIEVDRTKNRLIFSEKAVSEAKILAQQQKALDLAKEGETYKGIVSGIAPFGVFVRTTISKDKETGLDLYLDGLIHISEVSWEKVEDLKKLYKVGETLDVKVIGIDEKTGKLTLSVKRLKGDPWEDILEKYPEGQKVKGEVTKLAPFGAFVNLEPGVDGLIHISKIPAEKEINVGQEVECYIESIDAEQRRISLGLVLAKKPIGYK